MGDEQGKIFVAAMQEIIRGATFVSGDIARSTASLNVFKLTWFVPRQKGALRARKEVLRVPDNVLSFLPVLEKVLTYSDEAVSGVAKDIPNAYGGIGRNISAYSSRRTMALTLNKERAAEEVETAF